MTDGWGDASGIEGNYEDEAERADSGETSPVDDAAPDAPAETSDSNQTKKTSQMSQTNKTNIKDEWNGRTIYIPDDILDEMEDTYLESQLKLRKAGRDEFKKNRHFYPLLVQFGLEALSEADTDDIQTRLDALRGE